MHEAMTYYSIQMALWALLIKRVKWSIPATRWGSTGQEKVLTYNTAGTVLGLQPPGKLPRGCYPDTVGDVILATICR